MSIPGLRAASSSACVVVMLALSAGCGQDRQQANLEPIPGVAVTQQRAIVRNDFGWQWPLRVGRGTLGCVSGAVLFRSGDVTYALNEAAASKGYSSIQPLQLTSDPGPSRPLGRIKQDERMAIFAEAIACKKGTTDPTQADACAERVRERHGLSVDELNQIEAEGRERGWRPLPPHAMTVAPLVEAGKKLCAP